MHDSPQGAIRILIVGGYGLFRESLARLLATEPGFEIIAHCGTTEEAAGMLRDHQVDLLLLDFDFGDRDCTKFVRSAVEGGFNGKMLLVTAATNGSYTAELIRLGVAGVFLKHDLPALLTEAIRDVVGGKAWLDQQVLRGTVAAVTAHRGQGSPLTERERKVLSHVLKGLKNKAIGERLGVSETSVKASLQQLFSKTGVRTRSQLILVALKQYKDLF